MPVIISLAAAEAMLLCGCNDAPTDTSDDGGGMIVTNSKAVMEGEGVMVEE